MVIEPASGAGAGARDDLRRGRPGVERRRALRGEPAQEVGIGLVDQPVAGVEQGAVGLGEIGDHVGRVVLGEVGRGSCGASRGRDDEALRRPCARRRRTGCARAACRARRAPGRASSRAPGTPVARPLTTAVVERQRLAGGVEEHRRARLRRRDFAAVVDGDLAGACRRNRS